MSGTGYTLTEIGRSSTNVNHGHTFSFILNINSGYGGNPVVKANNIELEPITGVYRILNITSDQTITVDGLLEDSYAIILTEGEGYTLSPEGVSTSPVGHNGTFSFTLSVEGGYIGTPVVKVNGVDLDDVGGVYTINNITENKTVTVEGLIGTYEVVLRYGAGYTLTEAGTSYSPVNHGGSFSFVLEILEGYGGTPIVKANGAELEGNDGVYIIKNITEYKEVTVEGISINRYTVGPMSGNGYTINAQPGSLSPADYDGSFSFTLSITDGYEGTPLVKANGAELNDVGGVYTISNIKADQKITVEGITIRTYNIVFIEDDGHTPVTYKASSPTVNHGESFSFRILITEGYGGTPVVKANGDTVTPVAGIYTIYNITTDQEVTVEGITIKTYGVGPMSGTGYTLAAEAGSSSPVDHGGPFSFTLSITGGYEGTPLVKANGVELDHVNGVYTIDNIKADQKITVEGITIKRYTAGPMSGTGYTLTEAGRSLQNVNHGGSFSFMLIKAEGYEGTPVVMSNGDILKVYDGVYVIFGIMTDQTITVEGLSIIVHTVTVSANAGGSFEYRINGIGTGNEFMPVGADGNIYVPYGSALEIRSVPDAGYKFAWNSHPGVAHGVLTITSVKSSESVGGTFRESTGGNLILIAAILAALAAAGLLFWFFFLRNKGIRVGKIDDELYTDSQIRPMPWVKYRSKPLTAGEDYVYEYGENKEIGEGTVTVKLTNGRKGEVTVTFRIVGSVLKDSNN
jgi:hypothetical protein